MIDDRAQPGGKTGQKTSSCAPGPAGWAEEKVFHEADAYFADLLEAIAVARRCIECEVYIFEADSLGQRIAAAFSRAAARGVTVRVMVDAVGSPGFSEQPGASLEKAGVSVRIFNPKPWSLPLKKLTRLIIRPITAMYLLNRRNHRKLTIVDDEVAWLGSSNVTERSLRESRGTAAWHECGVRVRGPEVAALKETFAYTWDRIARPLAGLVERPVHRRRMQLFRSAHLVRLNSPAPLRRRARRDLLGRLRAARRRIWIESPYFVPPYAVVSALRHATARGVDVRLIVPAESDVSFMHLVISTFYGMLLRHGVHVYEYLPSMLHAKILLIDDAAVVGSTNFNHRSFLHDLEVDIILTAPASLESLATRFMVDREQSREVTIASEIRRPWWKSVAGRLLLAFRYWM